MLRGVCGVCQEVKSGSLQQSMFAAGFAGLAVGAKLSWQRAVARVKRRSEPERTGSTSDSPVSTA